MAAAPAARRNPRERPLTARGNTVQHLHPLRAGERGDVSRDLTQQRRQLATAGDKLHRRGLGRLEPGHSPQVAHHADRLDQIGERSLELVVEGGIIYLRPVLQRKEGIPTRTGEAMPAQGIPQWGPPSGRSIRWSIHQSRQPCRSCG